MKYLQTNNLVRITKNVLLNYTCKTCGFSDDMKCYESNKIKDFPTKLSCDKWQKQSCKNCFEGGQDMVDEYCNDWCPKNKHLKD